MYEQERKIDESEARELAGIEAELAAFQPGPSRLDRDRTMYLAGRASVQADTASIPSKVTRRRWATALAAMTATAGCLLLAVVVQHRSIVALRADVLKTVEQPTAEQAPVKLEQPVDDATDPETPPHKALVDDSEHPEFEPGRFDFSEKRLLALADSGTLTARSFMMMDEPQPASGAESIQDHDWPQQTYEPRSQPVPYYKLLKQMQEAGI